MGIGANIKQLLKTQGKTIKWLSIAAEIPVNTLYNITKRDEINVHPKNLEAIAKSLNVSVNELTGIESAPTPQPAETSKETTTITSDSADSQIKENTSSAPSTKLSLKQLYRWEFRQSMKMREGQENALRKNTFLAHEDLEQILQRRHDEDKLLKYFFLLKPEYREMVILNAEQLLFNQEDQELYGQEPAPLNPLSEEPFEVEIEFVQDRDKFESEIESDDDFNLEEFKKRGEIVSHSLTEKLNLLDAYIKK